jgi:hypothetical protein
MLIMTEPNRELVPVATPTSRFGDIVPLPFKLASNTLKIVYGGRGIFIFNNGRWVIMLVFKAFVVSSWAFGL